MARKQAGAGSSMYPDCYGVAHPHPGPIQRDQPAVAAEPRSWARGGVRREAEAGPTECARLGSKALSAVKGEAGAGKVWCLNAQVLWPGKQVLNLQADAPQENRESSWVTPVERPSEGQSGQDFHSPRATDSMSVCESERLRVRAPD